MTDFNAKLITWFYTIFIIVVFGNIIKTCYNTFYHPENMFLVVTGNFNTQEILNSIIQNQQKKLHSSS